MNVIVHLAHGCNIPTFHVNFLPFTTGCPTFGLDVEDDPTYSIFAGRVSTTVPGHATVPLFPYVSVYVTISPEDTTGLSTLFRDQRSTHCIRKSALEGLFSNNVSGSFVAETVKLLLILKFVQTGAVAFILTRIVIVHLAHGCNVPTFRVNVFPFTVGCPIFGFELAEFAT